MGAQQCILAQLLKIYKNTITCRIGFILTAALGGRHYHLHSTEEASSAKSQDVLPGAGLGLGYKTLVILILEDECSLFVQLSSWYPCLITSKPSVHPLATK